TGFARLTYRLGGSRRRNVPDQMEQPMMRNEHIVRAHQNAVVATNPITGQPWRVIHVDNNTTSPATGNGSITNPVASLGGTGAQPNAETIATRQNDIILVHSSAIPYSNTPAVGTNMFSFQNDNQLLIGDGSAQTVPTLECGNILITTSINPSLYPIISPQANDTGIFIASDRFNETVSGFNIRVSAIGIDGQSATGTNTFNDLTINNGLTGIQIGGGANYDMSDDIAFSQQTGTGLLNNGTGEITLTNTTFSNIAGTAIRTNAGTIRATSVAISNTAGDGIIVGNTSNPTPPPALLPAPLLEMTASTITNSLSSGIILDGNGSLSLNSSQIEGSQVNGILATTGSTGSINLNESVINGSLAGGGISQRGIFMQGTTGVTATNTAISTVIDGIEITGNARLEMNGGSIRGITNDGIIVAPTAPGVTLDGSAMLTNVSLSTIGDNGIRTIGQGVGGDISFIGSSMVSVGQIGILGSGVGNADSGSGASINVRGSSFSNIGDTAIQVTDSNLRVNNTTFASTGDFGINSIDGSTVLVEESNFIGTTVTGIQASANNTLSFSATNPTGRFNYLTARDNTISSTTNGIVVQGEIVPGGIGSTITSQGIVRTRITQNNISATNPISLTTINGVAGTAATANVPPLPPDVSGGLTTGTGTPQGVAVAAISRTSLQSLNNGATVTESPTAPDPETTTTSVDYLPTVNILVPPQ
ncbi:MAG: beta strand repeat-containing protein, partial [Pirellulales bacterium]